MTGPATSLTGRPVCGQMPCEAPVQVYLLVTKLGLHEKVCIGACAIHFSALHSGYIETGHAVEKKPACPKCWGPAVSSITGGVLGRGATAVKPDKAKPRYGCAHGHEWGVD